MRGKLLGASPTGVGKHDGPKRIVGIGALTVAVLLIGVLSMGTAGAVSATGASSGVVLQDCGGGEGDFKCSEPTPTPTPEPDDGSNGEEESGGDTVPPEVISFDATLMTNSTVHVEVTLDELLGNGHVTLRDDDGNHLAQRRLTKAREGRYVYDTNFSVSPVPGDSYLAELDEARDRSYNEVENPEQYNDTASRPAPNESEESTTASDPETGDPGTTTTTTATPAPDTGTAAPTTDGSTTSEATGNADGDGGDGATTTTASGGTTTAGSSPAETTAAPAEDPGDDDDTSESGLSGPLLVGMLAALTVLGTVGYLVRRQRV